jgi:deoxycytidylate deaminase
VDIFSLNEKRLKIKMETVINEIFKQIDDNIIIGLTGRTGSGCTTLSKLISSELMLDDAAPSKIINKNERRKYRIIKDYIKENWSPFSRIQLSNIITSYIFDYTGDFFSGLPASSQNETDIIKKFNELKRFYEINVLLLNNEVKIDENKIENTYDFYFNKLPQFSEELREYLSKHFTKTFQDIGDNIRRAGTIYGGDSDPKKFFCIMQRTNLLMQITKLYNKKLRELGKEVKDYFVIDAFRNPYEALFFKSKYSYFYLVSISTTKSDRENRLMDLYKYTKEDIEAISLREFPEQDVDFEKIDVKSCIEHSDIHIENPNNNTFNKYSNLKYHIAKYVALMKHPGLITPSKDERCMQVAYTAKFNSGCISRQVGAVVTDQDYSIKSVGWNDTPYGQVPCLLRSMKDLINRNDEVAYSDYELKNPDFYEIVKEKYNSRINNPCLKGKNYSYCFKDIHYYDITKKKSKAQYVRALHAEENAFLQIAKYSSGGINNGILYVTASPCDLCSKKAYQLGIKRIVFIDTYPGIAQDLILNCGDNRPSVEIFSGAIGRAYHQMYESVMPYKDELSILFSNSEK